MVVGKIMYYDLIMTSDEWEESVNDLAKKYPKLALPILDDIPNLTEVQAHYFLIFSNHVKQIKSGIRRQAKSQLGCWNPIVLDAKLATSENCEFYRIDVPREITIYRKPIYDVQSRWIVDKTLPSKSPKQISNLIKKLQAGQI